MHLVGIDIGASAIKLVLLEEEKLIFSTQSLHAGDIISTLKALLLSLKEERAKIGVCGTGAGLLKGFLPYFNEVVALSKGASLYFDEGTLIEIGAQNAKLVILKDGKIEEFCTNTICAAGTGSFLEQQAKRLKLSMDEFVELAKKSTHPARVAGRCSVFAKTDMIHLQQEGCPLEDIVAGLCLAFARNFKATFIKGKITPPIIFVGGVSKNEAIRNAFKKVWEIDEIIVPENALFFPAIGAALLAKDKESVFIKELIEKLPERIQESSFYLPPLKREEDCLYTTTQRFSSFEPVVYLGIDIGSISTNIVLMDDEGKILAKRYLLTKGRPIEVVKEGIEEIYNELGEKLKEYKIGGVCTTGSGRYLIAHLLGADLVKNEITAQARAAVHIDPSVDTIFEIGGQDSKYISIEDGAIVDFEMNKVCAAGTGSFLEEQAEYLKLDIKSTFQDKAFESTSPASLGERCTVFMETAVVTAQQKGALPKDLAAGLCYSIVQNYLQRVVQNKKVGERIFFQGGVAANKAVKSAFEEILKKKIIVPEHHEVTGAWGCCLLAREHYKNTLKKEGRLSSFLGFENIINSKYRTSSFECPGCPNHCLIHKVESERKTLYYGGRCEKYEVDRERKVETKYPDLFKEWEELTFPHFDGNGLKIGMPRALLFYELYPFFYAFFKNLGATPLLSPSSRRQFVEEGIAHLWAQDPCFPVKLAHGHVAELLKEDVDALFLPSIVNLASSTSALKKEVEGGWKQSYACPYEQTLPHLLNVAFSLKERKNVLFPTLHFAWRSKYWEKPLIDSALLLGYSEKEAKKALKEALHAYTEYTRKVKERGEKIIKECEYAFVLIGRPYNVHDAIINLGIPQKMREMGIFLIPMDYLPYQEKDIGFFPNMYWHYGQRIIAAAQFLKEHDGLFPIYLSNFGCGPDSFLLHFFKEMLHGHKPLLIIEVDEHSAPAGIITRLEAYIESVSNYKKKKKEVKFKKDYLREVLIKKEKRKIYVPYMSDHAKAVSAAMRRCGVDSEVMPPQDEETLKWGRMYTSGRECYPCIITVGDMVRQTKRADFDPKKSAFFLGGSSGPCRFGQYSMLQRLILNQLGLEDVPIYAPNQARDFYKELKYLGKEFAHVAWSGIVAVDILQKCLLSYRPYNLEAENIYLHYLALLERYIEEKRSLKALLKEAAKDFSSLKKDGQRPLIGMVGEIFVRANTFSNEDVIRKIEALGGEVEVAPVYEWFLYRNFRRKMHSVAHYDIFCYITTHFQHLLQKRIEESLCMLFEGVLKNFHEPKTEEVLSLASPYLPCAIEGEAILSVGKAVDFIKKGARGIVNVMPFTCMPGTITTALLQKVQKDYDVPVLNIAYDGLSPANTDLRLEAFLYQISS